MTGRLLLRGLMLIASLLAVGFLVNALHAGTAFDKAWIDSSIRGQGLSGELLFVGATALFASVGLPRQIIAFLGGYAFGFANGTALALVAVTLACVMTFFYARFLGHDFISKRFPGRIRRIDRFLSDNPFTMTLLIRLLPAGSNLLTNLAAGVSSVRPIPFIAGSALGYIPQTVVFALGGSGVTLEPGLRISLSIALFVASGFIGVYLYRRYRHGRSFDKAIDRQLGTEEGRQGGTN